MTEYRPIPCYCGKSVIQDLQAPNPNELDLDHIFDALCHIRRFSNDRRAMTVHQHRALVWQLAFEASQPKEVLDWAWHHDDHEGILGDIVTPVEMAIGRAAGLDILKHGLDIAIADRHGIVRPSQGTRKSVHFFDKLAASWERVVYMNCPQTSEAWDQWIDDGWRGIHERTIENAFTLAELTAGQRQKRAP